ncbi:hypothetical protein ABH940_003457 [Streptacidiphilus sp. BW17]|uniref:hypothetical protein n=1 Tax=Streptacidiphilus sp. BW17 TaxID=3156274 RepID=UPI00351169BD
MTANPSQLSRSDLADLLSDAAQRVSQIISAEYPTPPGRSYLHPVLVPHQPTFALFGVGSSGW